jgi:putative membrane protein
MMWECEVPAAASWGGWHHIWGLGATLLLAAAFVGIFLLGSKKADKTRRADRDDSLGIIKARLARGEIDQEEYLEMKKILEQA